MNTMSFLTNDIIDHSDVDPAAEFLAREQNQLAGLEDEFQPSSPYFKRSMVGDIDDKNDSFEIIEAITKNSPYSHSDSNGINDTVTNQINGTMSKLTISETKEEEPEKIRKWRAEQKHRLQKKDEDEERIKNEWQENAKKELHDWCQKHDEAINKIKSANRIAAKNAEKQYMEEIDRSEPGSEWEKVAKLCDFNSKTTKSSKDVSRMRSIILQMKQSSNKIPQKAQQQH